MCVCVFVCIFPFVCARACAFGRWATAFASCSIVQVAAQSPLPFEYSKDFDLLNQQTAVQYFEETRPFNMATVEDEQTSLRVPQTSPHQTPRDKCI
eukprot:2295718-Amphidinium_carterae.1